MEAGPTLSSEDIDAIGRRVVELLEGRSDRRWGTVKSVAQALGVQEWWVYHNARRLGGVKLGPAKGAPWRFDMERVHQVVASAALEERSNPPVDGSRAPAPAPARPARPSAGERAALRRVTRLPRPGFDDVDHPLAMLDLSGRFTVLNAAFSRLVGYSEAEFSRACWPSPHDRLSYEERSALLRAIASGEVDEVSFAGTYLHGQGLVVEIVGRLGLVRDDEGQPDHLLLRVQNGR